MLGWLFRRWWRPRAIFRYSDGRRTRYADPIEAWAKLEEACGADPETLLRDVCEEPPPGTVGEMLSAFTARRKAAADRLAAGVCVALGVAPLGPDGSGLTRRERVDLAAEFIIFLSRLAVAARPFVTSPSPTG